MLTLNKQKIILQTFNKSKKLTAKLQWAKPDVYALLFFLAQPSLATSLTLLWTIARFLDPFYTFSPAHRRVIHDLTPPNPFECIGIQFFNSLTCDLRDAMPRQRSLTLTHMWLTGRHATPEVTLHIPREAEDFPRGDRHFKHAPLPTYLICLSPKGLYW